MRQTSLLDSFIQRQTKKPDEQQSHNKKEQKEQLRKVQSHQPKQKNKRSKMRLDSDQEPCNNEEEQVSDVIDGIEDMELSDQEIKQNKKQRGGKARKSQGKQLTLKKEQLNQLNKDENPLAQFTDATPVWAQKQNCLDAEKRSPNDPKYDPTTLHVPQDAWSKFTAPMKQFWKIKSQNFDKVVLFKLGKFYQLFYDDAAIGNKYLNLKYMGTKMHTGFPEKCLDKYLAQLVDLGFKTVVVQQMETPDQMQSRVAQEKKQGRKSEKTLNREITQILTKGTYASKNESQAIYMPNYLLSLRIYGEVYGYSLLQMSTNEITMGTVDSLDKFKTVLYQTRPSELVYDPDNLNNEVIRIMEKTFLQMQMSKLMNKNNIWHPLNSLSELDRLEKEGRIKKSKIFQIINGFPDVNKNLLYATLSGMFNYLKAVFKFDYLIGTLRFTFYQKDTHSKNLILDSQALQHLEIFETAQGVQHSLFNKIDRTKTKFGKRLLRKWFMSPLMNQFHINQRLNAVEDIEKLSTQKQRFCAILKKLPDLDKKINILYHYAIKTTSASKAIYFEDINTSRLKQFKQIMQKMQETFEALKSISNCKKQFKSTRLKQLLTLSGEIKLDEEDVYFQDEDDQSTYEGLLPDVQTHLDEFKAYVKWQGNTPIPQKGLVTYFDQIQVHIERLKDQMEKYIDSVRYEMNEPNLKFVHTKERYEIEIPEKAEKRKPAGFEFSSKRAGFSRYISPVVKKQVKELEKLEEELKSQMGLFIGFFFEEFKKKQRIWQRFVEIIAQLDCLISLSEYSFLGQKVRPRFEADKCKIKGARHPCLTNIEFIPNDIDLKRKVMLLTGPNMGGKSTILRTVCTLAILAQIGCYVPAQAYDCELIDRIFTRIGASDRLELGKSTFFIEMEETKSVLEHATSRSLAIIDELGRGTSTFDGLAIAYSVLKNMIENIKCYCLFATHYHILIDEFRNREEIQLMMMDSLVKEENIIFLYKLVPGHVGKSFGLSVAQRVGISPETIAVATREAGKMNNYIEGKRKAVLSLVQDFLKESD